MEFFGVPAQPDAQASDGPAGTDEALNLAAWFQKGWGGVGRSREKGVEFVAGIFDRFREADALAFDSEDEKSEN